MSRQEWFDDLADRVSKRRMAKETQPTQSGILMHCVTKENPIHIKKVCTKVTTKVITNSDTLVYYKVNTKSRKVRTVPMHLASKDVSEAAIRYIRDKKGDIEIEGETNDAVDDVEKKKPSPPAFNISGTKLKHTFEHFMYGERHRDSRIYSYDKLLEIYLKRIEGYRNNDLPKPKRREGYREDDMSFVAMASMIHLMKETSADNVDKSRKRYRRHEDDEGGVPWRKRTKLTDGPESPLSTMADVATSLSRESCGSVSSNSDDDDDIKEVKNNNDEFVVSDNDTIEDYDIDEVLPL